MKVLTKFIESKEGLTMIKAQALTSNGWQNKYFVVDTGATNSLFSPEVCKAKNICDSIADLNGNILVTERCTARLSLADKNLSIDGHVVDYETLPKIDGKQLSGLLGVDFFINNRIILDFDNDAMCLKESWGGEINKHPFVPMKIGQYGLCVPTISVNCNSCELSFIVDTGATSNIIAPAISDRGKGTKDVGTFIVKGIASDHFAKECELEFQIKMSNAGRFVKHAFHDVFTFIEQGPPLNKSSVLNVAHGLIGNDFIHRHKWIIDFAERKILRKLERTC